MLFNSIEFIFFFLPITFAAFYSCMRYAGKSVGLFVLLAASLFFYAWWNPRYIALLFGSIVFNYWVSRVILAFPQRGKLAFATLLFGIGADLALIGYFKYFNFFISNVNLFLKDGFSIEEIILPLGISFFSFQQIIYLVDSYSGKCVKSSFMEYALFVSFFPQLIAGPIVQPNDLLPQILKYDHKNAFCQLTFDGIAYFLLGLFKKVVLADSLSMFLRGPFRAADSGCDFTFFESLYAMLGYTFQLYFDFSGYCDMAIGLGMIFGVHLPTNFNSPYKAKSIIDFWRRWHITLSRFLRDYVYIPLGGNRRGAFRRYQNLILTMLIGGLWHGANWTFVFWGGLHGVYLAANHIFVSALKRFDLESIRDSKIYGVFAWALTFFCVAVAWVFFRAETFKGAAGILEGLAFVNGIALPSQLLSLLPQFVGGFVEPVGSLAYAGNSTLLGFIFETLLILLSFILVLFSPNIPEMSNRRKYLLVFFTFAFSLQKVLFGMEMSEFIYFQF